MVLYVLRSCVSFNQHNAYSIVCTFMHYVHITYITAITKQLQSIAYLHDKIIMCFKRVLVRDNGTKNNNNQQAINQ